MEKRKIVVVGAGFVGMTCAQRVVEQGLGDCVLIDIVEGRPQGVALDLNQAGPVVGYEGVVTGTNDPKDTHGADLVIVTAGLPRKPGMDRSDLLDVNAKIILDVADYVRDGSPKARVIVITNPLDSMTHLMRARTGFAPERVVGMAGVLDSARFRTFLAESLSMGRREVEAMVLGGHGDSMVPVRAYASAGGVPVQELMESGTFDAIADRTRNGGAEIVAHLKTGSAYYAPSASAVAMAASILNDERRIFPAAALLNGPYGLEGVTLGVPVVLGSAGVEKIVELNLTAEDRAALHHSGAEVQADLDLLSEKGLL